MGYANLPEDWGSWYSTCSDCGGRYHASGAETCACPECPTCGMQVPPGTIYAGKCQNCAPLCFYCEERQVEIYGPQKEAICDVCKTEHYTVPVSTMLLEALAMAGEELQRHIPKDATKQRHVARSIKELERLRKLVDQIVVLAPKAADQTIRTDGQN